MPVNSTSAAGSSLTYTFPHAPVEIIVVVMWSVTILMGLLGNCLLIWTIFSKASLRTAMNTYVLSIGFLDLLTCVGLLPFYMFLHWWWYEQNQEMPTRMNGVDVFIRTFTDVGRLLMMTSLGVERYQSIAKPFAISRDKGQKRARVIILLQWTISVVLASIATRFFCSTAHFTYYTFYKLQKACDVTSLSLNEAVCSSNASLTNGTSAESFISNCWGNPERYIELPLTVVSVIVIVLSYSLILNILRQQKRKLGAHDRSNTDSSKSPRAGKMFSKAKVWPLTPNKVTPVPPTGSATLPGKNLFVNAKTANATEATGIFIRTSQERRKSAALQIITDTPSSIQNEEENGLSGNAHANLRETGSPLKDNEHPDVCSSSYTTFTDVVQSDRINVDVVNFHSAYIRNQTSGALSNHMTTSSNGETHAVIQVSEKNITSTDRPGSVISTHSSDHNTLCSENVLNPTVDIKHEKEHFQLERIQVALSEVKRNNSISDASLQTGHLLIESQVFEDNINHSNHSRPESSDLPYNNSSNSSVTSNPSKPTEAPSSASMNGSSDSGERSAIFNAFDRKLSSTSLFPERENDLNSRVELKAMNKGDIILEEAVCCGQSLNTTHLNLRTTDSETDPTTSHAHGILLKEHQYQHYPSPDISNSLAVLHVEKEPGVSSMNTVLSSVAKNASLEAQNIRDEDNKSIPVATSSDHDLIGSLSNHREPNNDVEICVEPVNSENPSALKSSESTSSKVSEVVVVDMNGTVNVQKVEASSSAENAVAGAVCLMNPHNKVLGRRRVELKAALKVGFLLSCFVCLWVPFPLTAALGKTTSNLNDKSMIQMLFFFSALASTTAALNPITYGLLNRPIRNALVANMKGITRCLQRPF